jgi:NTE family protein
LKRIFFALAIIIPLISFSQRQRVAVVLSGGGSKGLAHIGVLKALEDNNIPIDYIAGTSMGAIIGSMYASGYSPKEIEEIVISEDFQNWAWGKIDDKYIDYYKEQAPDGSWFNFRFNYDSVWEYKLPTNLIPPYQVDYGLMYFLASASAASNNNFDSLYIPFRCVASDIAEKRPVVFRNGYLPEAVRASMTYPFYFKPIRVNGKLLYDGGMYNNFPSNIVYDDFMPDVILGSNVSKNSEPPKETELMSLIENMLTTSSNYSTICDVGVMIEPKLEKAGEFDFSKAGDFINAGYSATMLKFDSIKRIVHDTISVTERSLKRKRFTAKKPKLKFSKIGVTGVNKFQAVYIRRLMLDKKDTLDAEKLKEYYFSLLSDDKIESIYPKALYDQQNKKYDLTLDIKRNKAFTVQIGGLISSGPINGAYIGLEYKYMGVYAANLKLNTYIGQFYNSVQLKTRMDFPTKLPFYFEAAFTYNYYDYFKSTIGFFEDKNPSYLFEHDLNFRSDFVFPIGKKSKMSAGFQIASVKDSYYQTNAFSKNDTTDRTFFNFISPEVKYDRKSLDQKQYSTYGSYFMLNARYIYGEEQNTPGSTSENKEYFETNHDWIFAKVQLDKYFRHLGFYTFGIYAEGVYTNKPLFNNYTSSILTAPAFQPTPESKVLFLPNYRANFYAAAGIKNLFNIYKKLHFRLEGYVFQPYQKILDGDGHKAYYGVEFYDRYFLATAALVYHSPICPISLSVSYYPGSDKEISVMFNIGYIMFNNKALN